MFCSRSKKVNISKKFITYGTFRSTFPRFHSIKMIFCLVSSVFAFDLEKFAFPIQNTSEVFFISFFFSARTAARRYLILSIYVVLILNQFDAFYNKNCISNNVLI